MVLMLTTLILGGAMTAAPTPAVPVSRFLDSLGANSAVCVRGENLESTIEATRFLGLRWYRLGYESDIPVSTLLELHRQTGVRFSYGLQVAAPMSRRLLRGRGSSRPEDALVAIEGNNEPNNWGSPTKARRAAPTSRGCLSPSSSATSTRR